MCRTHTQRPANSHTCVEMLLRRIGSDTRWCRYSEACLGLEPGHRLRLRAHRGELDRRGAAPAERRLGTAEDAVVSLSVCLSHPFCARSVAWRRTAKRPARSMFRTAERRRSWMSILGWPASVRACDRLRSHRLTQKIRHLLAA